MISIKYTKLNNAKYISHLDLMRVFCYAIRRCGLVVEYSEGFNPHPLIYFSPPLPIGVESVCEYAAIALKTGHSEFMDKMNENLPDGIRIIEAKKIAKNPNYAAKITKAEYEIALENPDAITEADIKKIVASKSYEIEFLQKDKMIKKEVRDKIYLLEKRGDKIIAVLGVGADSLRPDRLVNYILRQKGQEGLYFSISKTRAI